MKIGKSIHPSIFYTAYPKQGHGDRGAYPPYPRVSGYEEGDTLDRVTTHLRAISYTTGNFKMSVTLQYMSLD